MSLEIDLDLDGIDVDAAERGNALPEGWFLAVVDDVHPDAKSEGTIVLELRVEGGDYDGVKVYDRLYDPLGAKDTDAARACDNRRAIFAKRLGLIVKDPSDPAGKHYIVNVEKCPNGRLDFEAAIGAEVAIKMVRKSVKDDSTGKWSKKDRAELDFAGIFGRDHAGIPAEVAALAGRATLLPSPAPGQTRPAAAAKAPPAPAKDPLAGL